MVGNENMNELLYMVRMNDEWALNEIFKRLKTSLQVELNKLVFSYSPLLVYRDELEQEERIAVYTAIERYQPERDISFSVYAVAIARNAMRKLIRKLNHQYISGFNGTRLIYDVLKDDATYMNLIQSKDVLSDPQYVLRMREAYDVLEKTLSRKLKPEDVAVKQCWMEGGTYLENCKKLGMTYKQYESRITKIKKRVYRSLSIS